MLETVIQGCYVFANGCNESYHFKNMDIFRI